jgi:hypothetical protein
MSIIFNPEEPMPLNGFNAVFLTQSSYMNLLELVKISLNGYDFNGFNFNIPKLPYSYMLITNKPERLRIGLGKSVSLKISHLAYNSSSLSIIALVLMKNNFTDKKIPHICITGKRPPNDDISLTDFKVVPLHAPYTVHGKLGVMSCNIEESTTPSHFSSAAPVMVSRPELTLSVENSPPPGNDEYYMGQKVEKGARGGKYIYIQGKKRYITDEMIANAKNKGEVVYNINFLSDPKPT